MESIEITYKTIIKLGIAGGLLFGAGFLFGKFYKPDEPPQQVAVNESTDLDKRQADYEKVQEKIKLSYYDHLTKEPRRKAFDAQPSAAKLAPTAGAGPVAETTQAGGSPIEQGTPAAGTPAAGAPAAGSPDVAPPPPKVVEEKPSSDRMVKALEKALGNETPDSISNSAKAQLPTHTGSAFAVQVASLPDRKVAEELAKKLNLRGYDTRLVQADIPGRGIVYRVRIHGFDTRQAAEETRAIVAKNERLDAITVAQ